MSLLDRFRLWRERRQPGERARLFSRLVGPWEPARDPLADDPVAQRLGLVDAGGQRLCDCLVGQDCPHGPRDAPTLLLTEERHAQILAGELAHPALNDRGHLRGCDCEECGKPASRWPYGSGPGGYHMPGDYPPHVEQPDRCPSCCEPTAGVWPDPDRGPSVGRSYEPCGCAAGQPEGRDRDAAV